MNTNVTRQSVEVFLILIPGLVVAMALHELAHGLVANRLGDPTARVLGRLSLNPIRHLDPLGTAMFAITYFGAGWMFGWAKPVPVDMRNFDRPKRDMALVALAGPLTNFAIALVLVAVALHAPPPPGVLSDVLDRAIQVNIVLGIFNLVPVPPLDGSRVLGAFMDDHTYRSWLGLDRYAMLFFVAIFFVLQGTTTPILSSATNHVLDAMIRVVGG